MAQTYSSKGFLGNIELYLVAATTTTENITTGFSRCQHHESPYSGCVSPFVSDLGNPSCPGPCEGEQISFAHDSLAAMVMQVSSTSVNRDRPPVPAIATVPSSSQSNRPRPALAPPAPSQLESSLLSRKRPLSSSVSYNYQAHITGAVLFDGNGLPQEYFTTSQITLENWEQLIFQLLGLRWLLMSSLNFDNFGFARASSGNHTAVLLRQRETYLALLTENLQGKVYDLECRQWLSSFDLADLRQDERFQSF